MENAVQASWIALHRNWWLLKLQYNTRHSREASHELKRIFLMPPPWCIFPYLYLLLDESLFEKSDKVEVNPREK
jgi:hypothetical protein